MANSGSYARGDQARTVPDPDEARHAAAEQWQRKYNAAQAAGLVRNRGNVATAAGAVSSQTGTRAEPPPSAFPDVGHPGALESLIPVWGSGREALADLHDGDWVGAVGNGVLAASDLIPAKAIIGAVGKGAFKTGGTFAWRTKPWEEAKGVRQWLGERGYLKPGEAGHHWAIPQKEWGKAVPEWIKNQPWNIKGLDAVTHGRVHGRYTVDGVKLPRFNAVDRIRYGTPDWVKAAGVGGAGRAADATRHAVQDGVGQDGRGGR